MIKTGGRWDPSEQNVYFIAGGGGPLSFGAKVANHILCAVNEIQGEGLIEKLCQWADSGTRVFVDSGVFSLTNEHGRKHGMTMDQVLAMPPDEIEGFDQLFEKYCDIISKIGERVWGYIEIDQGGRDNKRRTRARLESLGFRPIPVYHPLVDGWDYFDELAEGYDRICFGNVVQADPETRKRLLATAWERRRKYPHLWIHLLGLTVNQRCNAYPVNSCDSSTWLSLVRWPDAFTERTAGFSFSRVPGFTYDKNSQPSSETGNEKAWQVGAMQGAFSTLNWRAMLNDIEAELGADRGGYFK